MIASSSRHIICTTDDEAPRLALVSFLPIIKSFAAAAGVTVGTRDISRAGRTIGTCPERRTAAFKVLRGQGVDLPDYPEDATSPEEGEARRRCDASRGRR